MSIITRISLIIGAIIVAGFILYKIRKGKLEINHALYWIGFSILLLIFGFFPGVVIWFSHLLGFISPANFVYIIIIALLLIKIFLMSIKMADLENQIRRFSQKYAMDKNKYNKKKSGKLNDSLDGFTEDVLK
jgi:hypothetical protein